jgi:hypothetical protein
LRHSASNGARENHLPTHAKAADAAWLSVRDAIGALELLPQLRPRNRKEIGAHRIMDTFHMIDIIPLLPLPCPPSGRSSYYVPCPECDRSGRKNGKHLNISLSKDVFRCPKCGVSGGVFDLYALCTGIPREGIRDELKRVLRGGGAAAQGTPKPAPPQPEAVELPVADIETRHAAYSALLSLLPLAPDHLRSLLDRGLTEDAVHEREYRTTPIVGEKALAKRISGDGHKLVGVPGFYRDKFGVWAFISAKRGILVPVRDVRGRIQGLQIRLDNAGRRKYRWVSSAGIESGAEGCGAEGWCHMAGPAMERVILTEGPMKADVIHHLTGQAVVAVPGVNSLRHLEPTLSELVGLGVRHAMTAFDMDFLSSRHVQSGYADLVGLLGRMGLSFGTYLWHPDYKGLDDYIWEHCRHGREPAGSSPALAAGRCADQ